jgi:hypothetical protein
MVLQAERANARPQSFRVRGRESRSRPHNVLARSSHPPFTKLRAEVSTSKDHLWSLASTFPPEA